MAVRSRGSAPRIAAEDTCAKSTELKGQVGSHAAAADPVVDNVDMALPVGINGVVLENSEGSDDRGKERRERTDDGDEGAAGALAKQPVQHEAEQRQRRDDPQVGQHAGFVEVLS